MKIKIKSNLKNFEKNLKKEIEKIVENEEKKVRTQNQSFLLDSESENLLSKLLASTKPFPKSLQEMFFDENGKPIEYEKDKNLRTVIHELIINGLITVKWGDGLPIIGRIEQKGKSYFEMKAKYSQLYNNGGNMDFKYLDTESEKVLKELLENKDFLNCPCFIVPSNYSPTAIENLINLGFLYSQKGVTYYNDGTFVCGARLTQKAKTYDEMKAKYEEYRTSNNISVYGSYNDLRGADLSHSVNQIGTSNSTQEVEITNEMIDEALNTILKNIEEYGLSKENKQDLLDMIEDVKDKQKNKPNLVKRALKGIWTFAKDVGCSLLSSYLAKLCGFV